MDKFGCLNANRQDWDLIADSLYHTEICSFPYCADSETAFIVTIAGPIRNHARMIIPWGGAIRGSYLVALRGKGSEYFDMGHRGERMFHPGYLGPKLGIKGTEAIDIAQLLNEVSVRLALCQEERA